MIPKFISLAQAILLKQRHFSIRLLPSCLTPSQSTVIYIPAFLHPSYPRQHQLVGLSLLCFTYATTTSLLGLPISTLASLQYIIDRTLKAILEHVLPYLKPLNICLYTQNQIQTPQHCRTLSHLPSAASPVASLYTPGSFVIVSSHHTLSCLRAIIHTVSSICNTVFSIVLCTTPISSHFSITESC